jgi:hypothetical protein
MNWTEHNKPIKDISSYDHVSCETPLGKALIEWKSWKRYDSYSVTIGDTYIGEGVDLDDAKKLAKNWLASIKSQLSLLLNTDSVMTKQTGIDLIVEEIQRQIDVEGHTLHQDVEYKKDELAIAAASYAMPETYRDYPRRIDSSVELKNTVPRMFPWSTQHWKPTPEDRIKELVKAGALIVAEIERLQNIS